MEVWLIIIACGLYILNEALKLIRNIAGLFGGSPAPKPKPPAKKPVYPRISAKQLKQDYQSGKLTRKGYIPPWERSR